MVTSAEPLNLSVIRKEQRRVRRLLGHEDDPDRQRYPVRIYMLIFNFPLAVTVADVTKHLENIEATLFLYRTFDVRRALIECLLK